MATDHELHLRQRLTRLRNLNLLGGTRLSGELEKLQRDTRAIVPPQTDAQACQARNRRIGRISSALTVIVNKQTTRH